MNKVSLDLLWLLLVARLNDKMQNIIRTPHSAKCGQFDVIVDFGQTALRHRSDGIEENGWFRTVLSFLALEPQGKIMITDMSQRAILWMTTTEGLGYLKQITADYFSFTCCEFGNREWVLPEFGQMFDFKWTQYRHSDVRDSPFVVCRNIKTMALQMDNSYVYLKGYDFRPQQDYMMIYPGTMTYKQFENYRDQWQQWRHEEFGSMFDVLRMKQREREQEERQQQQQSVH